jgi:hypothetical protein
VGEGEQGPEADVPTAVKDRCWHRSLVVEDRGNTNRQLRRMRAGPTDWRGKTGGGLRKTGIFESKGIAACWLDMVMAKE